MAKTTFRKRIINDKEYYFFRLRHKNLNKPKDLYAQTVKELTEKIKNLNYELEHGLEKNKDCFGTFLSDWLFNIRFTDLKPSTKERYEGLFRVYVKDSELSDIKIKELTSKDIQNFYNRLYKKHKSISQLRNLHKIISPCIKYAYNNNIIIKDYTSSIIFPKNIEVTTPNVVPFTLEEQQTFVRAIKGHELEMLFIAALNTGMRQGELFALTWNDVNFDNEYISVNKSIKKITEVSAEGRGKSKIIVQIPKTKGSIRKVNIPTVFANDLKQYKLKQAKERLAIGISSKGTTLIFSNLKGMYLRKETVISKFKEILKDNELADRKFHDLRHTYATRLFELGEEPKVIQTLLGHSSISMTLNTYTHILEATKKKTTTKLNDLYISMGIK